MKNPQFKFRHDPQINMLNCHGTIRVKEQTGMFFIRLKKELIKKGSSTAHPSQLETTITSCSAYTVMGNMRLFKVVQGGDNVQIKIGSEIELHERTGTATADLNMIEPDTDYIVMIEHCLRRKQISFIATIR